MPWTPERSTVNQKVQIGAESTSALGTAVAANKLIQCFNFTFGPNADVAMFRATGRKYDSTQIENTEWVDGSFGGTLDYNGVIYALASIMGSATAVTHGSSATAKDWVFTPPVTGSVVPQTYTIQQGDSVRAHSVAYSLVTEFGYKGDRKSGLSASGKLLCQPLSDGITMTASPTAIALAPIAGKHINVYLDATSGALGTTQLLKVLNIDYSFTSVYGPFYPFNRTNIGWTAHVDQAPKCTIRLLMEADATGMTQLTNLQNGSTQFLRISAQGLQIAADGPGVVNNLFQHDMAVKVSKPNTFSDKDGVFAEEWEFTVVEDTTWGKAQTITATNLLTAL